MCAARCRAALGWGGTHQRPRRRAGGRSMSVDVDPVRTIETPTRLVHGPGAVSALPEVVAELGMQRPLLVTDEGVVAAGLAARVIDLLPDPVVFTEVRAQPRHRPRRRCRRPVRGRGLRRPGGRGRRLADGRRQGDRRRGRPRRLDRAVRVGARPHRVPHPAARHRAHHGGHRQRGDALGGDHRPGPQGQVQRRRHRPHRGARRRHRPRAHARAAAGGHRRDRHGRAGARGRVLHVRLPPVLQRRRGPARPSSWSPRGSSARSPTAPTSRRAPGWRTRRPWAAWPTAPRAPAPPTP